MLVVWRAISSDQLPSLVATITLSTVIALQWMLGRACHLQFWPL